MFFGGSEPHEKPVKFNHFFVSLDETNNDRTLN